MKVNKLIQEDLFPTRIFVVDDLLEKKDVDHIKKDVLNLYKLSPKKMWQSSPKLQHQKNYKPLIEKDPSIFFSSSATCFRH